MYPQEERDRIILGAIKAAQSLMWVANQQEQFSHCKGTLKKKKTQKTPFISVHYPRFNTQQTFPARSKAMTEKKRCRGRLESQVSRAQGRGRESEVDGVFFLNKSWAQRGSGGEDEPSFRSQRATWSLKSHGINTASRQAGRHSPTRSDCSARVALILLHRSYNIHTQGAAAKQPPASLGVAT